MKQVISLIVLGLIAYFLKDTISTSIGWIVLGVIALALVFALIMKSGSHNVIAVNNKGDTNVNYHFHGAHSGRGTKVRDARTQRRMARYDEGDQEGDKYE